MRRADQRFVRRFILSKAFLFLILILGVRASLFAQTSSEIFGRVRDQQGLPIVGVEIVARADATGSEAKSITDSDGNFVVLGLQPGTYTITSTHSGFTTKVYEHVDLAVNQQIRLDMTLAVGSFEQTVTVGANFPLLETGTSSSGDTILPKQVESMPLNGRNYGDYYALIVGIRKQATSRFLLDVSYAFSHATDNLLSPNLNSSVQTGLGIRLTAFSSTTDSFIGRCR